MTDAGSNAADFSARLADAERQLREHPAYERHSECLALERTISDVFYRNARELLALLNQANTDQNLALELMQNVKPPVVRDEFHAVIIQRLHNYVAGTSTLVDHVRRIRRGRVDSVAEEFNRRLSAFNQHGEAWFVKDLRNYLMHRELPFLGHTVKFPDEDSDEGLSAEIQLDVGQLLDWENWSAGAKSFLAAQSEVIALRPLIMKHCELLLRLNAWLLEQLQSANQQGLVELNELIVARNAALTGGDIEQARRFTDEVTGMRTGWPESAT
jgi:hypothetical protein